ncbi:protein-disulfide reductase DsbD domain-containing protein [Inmirania thermothiophila]|uniref:Disulfide bond corrector protein DsbC n=1 Tax=Inmirania thermothiophila TaxID=1750597 RepID=A0A3N1XXE1_9GAMM|nr:protein-disulfide reductase DsbD domain-containing protein [Inmirania thermothiophila]ROR29597.1 disulfide bond corrector protein DsbC [Inmirania thermothiophila]
MRGLTALAATAWAAAAAAAPLFGIGGDEAPQPFLPADEAFVLSVDAPAPDRLVVRWEIAEGYYLYRSRLAFAAAEPDAVLGPPRLPPGRATEDAFLGRQEVYHRRVAVEVPVRWQGKPRRMLTLEVRYQGCAEAGLCYPPLARTVPVILPAP